MQLDRVWQGPGSAGTTAMIYAKKAVQRNPAGNRQLDISATSSCGVARMTFALESITSTPPLGASDG